MKLLKFKKYQIILAFIAFCCGGAFLYQNNAFADKTVSAKFPVKTSDFSFVEKPDGSSEIPCDSDVRGTMYYWVCDDGAEFGPYQQEHFPNPPSGYRQRSLIQHEFLINSFAKYSTDVWFSTTVNDEWKITGDATSGTIAVSGGTTVATLSFESSGHQLVIKKNGKACASARYLTDGSTQFQDVIYDLHYRAQSCLNNGDANSLSDWVEDHLHTQESFAFSELQTQLDKVPFTFFNGNSYSVNTGVDGPEFKDGEPEAKPVSPQDDTKVAKDTCESKAGTSLGWILCPTLSLASGVSGDIYKNFVEKQLELNTELFKQNQNNGTYRAWEMMRNFANIVFVILLLIVVFSQLTGVGVSNYGIKKILPKLIVVAVLVNLSFILCQILVDLSNILGASLYAFFKSLGADVSLSAELVGSEAAKASIATAPTVLSGIAILGALVAGVAIVLTKGTALIAPLLIGALSIFIGAIFLFILLAVRKAGVVMLVVLSPLAVVCYMLPNTKSLFDKWKKALTALLLLYPICGLLVGGGDFVSRILLASNTSDFWLALTAMIVSIAPIFFIPSLLKQSMTALGSIGGKLAGMKLGKQAAGKIKSAKPYQNFQQRRNINSRARFARSKAGKLIGKTGAGARWNNDAFKAAEKQQAGDVEAARASINRDPNMGTVEALETEYEKLINEDGPWSKKQAIRAEAIQQEMLARPRGAGKFNKLMEANSDKMAQHAGDIKAFLGRDAKGAGAAYAKDALVSQYINAMGTPGQQKQNYAEWFNQNARNAVSGLKDSEILGSDASAIKTWGNTGALTQEQARKIQQHGDYGKADGEVRAAIDKIAKDGRTEMNTNKANYGTKDIELDSSRNNPYINIQRN